MYVRGDDGGDWIRELWKSDMGTMNESFFFKKKTKRHLRSRWAKERTTELIRSQRRPHHESKHMWRIPFLVISIISCSDTAPMCHFQRCNQHPLMHHERDSRISERYQRGKLMTIRSWWYERLTDLSSFQRQDVGKKEGSTVYLVSNQS